MRWPRCASAEFASTLPVAGSACFSYAPSGVLGLVVIGWNPVLELAIGATVVAKGWSSYFARHRVPDSVMARKPHLGSLQLIELRS